MCAESERDRGAFGPAENRKGKTNWSTGNSFPVYLCQCASARQSASPVPRSLLDLVLCEGVLVSCKILFRKT